MSNGEHRDHPPSSPDPFPGPPPPPPGWSEQPPGWPVQPPPGYAHAIPEPEGGLLENAVRVLTAPVETLRRLTHHPRVGWAVVLVVVISALSFVAGAASIEPAPGDPFAPDFAIARAPLLLGGLLIGPVMALVFASIWTAILHGLARLFKGTGTFGGTFTGVGFAYVPTVLSVPFQLLPFAIGFAGSMLASLIGFAASIWSLVLTVIVVRECHRLSTGKAVAVVLIPVAVFMLLVLALVVLVIALVAGGIASMS